LEVGNMLLDAASDDLVDPDQIRRLLKELREVRMAKIRSGVDVLDAAATGGGGVALTGVGAMEIGESRGFVTGVVDGLRYGGHPCLDQGREKTTDTMSRKIGASKEQARREQMAEEMANGGYDATQDDEDEMEF
jgi:GINS complex subunit 2